MTTIYLVTEDMDLIDSVSVTTISAHYKEEDAILKVSECEKCANLEEDAFPFYYYDYKSIEIN